jgi:GTP cyclohydrolase I
MIEQSHQPNFDLVKQGFLSILAGLGLDDRSPHLKDTAERAAKAMYSELCAGLTQDAPKITEFPHSGESGMILLHRVPIFSLCAHHLLPFIGTATIGYISGNEKVLGVSKLSRIANYCARRPQVQEELTRDIADMMWKHIGSEINPSREDAKGGVGVVIRANHMCMQLRGVSHEGLMATSEMLGMFRKPEVRAEFLSLAKAER